jgi:periplasmic copper chaperone A
MRGGRLRATLAVAWTVNWATLAAMPSSGTRAQITDNGLSIGDPWFRLTIPSIPAAGYFFLSNATAAPQRLVGATTPACGALMLQRSVDQNGEQRIMSVSSVLVPGHSKIQFAPGDYHLICLSPTPEMKPGRSVPVTLRFSDGKALTATFPVRGTAER